MRSCVATDDAARKRAHVRVADVFDDSYLGRIRCVRELQRAGEGRRACELLVATSNDRQRAGAMDWGGMRLSLMAECTLRALEYWQANAGTPLEGIVLRRMLVLICSVYDWGLTDVADAHVSQLCRDSGMAFFAETDASQPDVQRVFECLKRAQQTYEATPEAERGLPPGDAVRDLAACAMPLANALCNIHDATRLRELRELIMPLRSLAPVLDNLIEFCVSRPTARSGARSAIGSSARSHACWQRMRCTEILRRGGAAVYSHIQAVDDARRGHPRALESMTRMVAAGTSDDMFLVVHGRWLGHAFRGDAAAAQRFCRQVEAITEDDVWRRKAFLFAEAQLFALTGDLAGLKRVAEAIGELARRFPGWRPWLAFTHASMHRLRGELEAARAQFEHALAEAQPGEHRAFIVVAPAHAELLLQLGDADGGLREAEGILEQVRALSLDASAEVAAERIRALCENALGRSDAARASIERAFARAAEVGFGGLPLAQLHEARARILLDMGEAEQYREELGELHRAIEHAEAPALVTAYQALREESSRKLSLSELPAFVTATRTLGDSSTSMSDVITRVSAAGARAKRARQALELLLEDSGARGGYLFLLRPSRAVRGSCGQRDRFGGGLAADRPPLSRRRARRDRDRDHQRIGADLRRHHTADPVDGKRFALLARVACGPARSTGHARRRGIDRRDRADAARAARRSRARGELRSTDRGREHRARLRTDQQLVRPATWTRRVGALVARNQLAVSAEHCTR